MIYARISPQGPSCKST